MFRPNESVRLTAFHRGEDHNGVVVELNAGDRFVVAGHVTGSADVRCRFPARPARTMLLPAAKLTRCSPADDPDADDGDNTGGGPVGAATVPGPGKRKGYPPPRAKAA